jgi:hypothetical protein
VTAVAPPPSAAAARRRVAAALRAAGAGRVSDHFVVPAADGRPWGGAHSPARHPLRRRDRSGEGWLRVADVPFDLLPLRPDAPERQGALFSLGPGLDRAGWVRPAVLLVQLEGSEEAVAAGLERLRPVLADVQELRSTTLPAADGGVRACLAGVVPVPGSASQPRLALEVALCA